ATPGRTWNNVEEDQLLSDYFDNSKVVLQVGNDPNPVKYLLNEGYLARPTFHMIDYLPKIVPTTRELRNLASADDFSDESLEKLAQDTSRNLAITASLEGLLHRGHRRIIVFSISVEHAKNLVGALIARKIQAEIVTGDTPSAKRSSIL